MIIVKKLLNFKTSFYYLKRNIIQRLMLIGVMPLLLLLIGCVPLQQHELLAGGGIRVLPGYHDILVDVLTNTSDPSQQPKIDEGRSFAVSPSGNRYKLSIQPSDDYYDEYVKRNPTSWMRKLIYLHDPSRKNNNRVEIGNGTWELNLFFTGPTPLEPIHAEFRTWTVWWFPLWERPF